MAAKRIFGTIVLKRGDAAWWAAKGDPVLLEGEPGVLIDPAGPESLRVGDGVTAFSLLEAVSPGPAGPAGAVAAPTLAENLVPDPQAKTSGSSGANSLYSLTRITTGLPPGFSHGLSTTRIGTLDGGVGQALLGGTISDPAPLRVQVTPGQTMSFSAMVWTDQSATRARLDVRWYSAADAILSTSTGGYVPLASATWETRGNAGLTVPPSATYAVLSVVVATVSGNTVLSAVMRATGALAALGATVPAYGDGSRASEGWMWTDTAHASTSKKSFVAPGDFVTPAGAATTAAAAAKTAVAYLGEQPSGIPIPIPGYSIPVAVRRNAFGYAAEVDLAAMHVRSTGTTLYVDPVNGNNSNNGLSWDTAKKSPSSALSAGGTYTVAEIIVRGGIYTRADAPLLGRADVIVRAEPGTRPLFTQSDTSTSWTVEGAAPVYKVALSGTNFVIDKTKVSPTTGLPVPLTPVASVAAVTSTPHSSYHNGTTQYVRLHDDRAPDLDVMVGRSTFHLNTTALAVTGPHRLYVEGCEFWGGVNAQTKAFAAGATFLAKSCAWRYANTNGLAIQGFAKTVLVDCEATHNGVDGFNYHDSGALTGDVLEVNCVGRLNGQTVGGSSQNGTTAHDNYRIVRVGGKFEFNPGPNVADVNNVVSVNFGVYAGDVLGYAGAPDYDYVAPELAGTLTLIDCVSRSPQALRAIGKTVRVSAFDRVGSVGSATLIPYAP